MTVDSSAGLNNFDGKFFHITRISSIQGTNQDNDTLNFIPKLITEKDNCMFHRAPKEGEM